MSFNITDEQKKLLVQAIVGAVVSLVLVVASILGFNVVVVQPAERMQEARYAQLLNELGFDSLPLPGDVPPTSDDGSKDVGGVGATAATGSAAFLCRGGTKPCLDSRYGRDLVGYSNNGVTQMWKIEGTDGTFTHKGFNVLTAGTTISPTDSGIITPTATYQPLSSAGTVTPTLSVTNTAGSAYANNTELVLYNTTNTTINLADSGNAKLSAAWAAGQYDTLRLRFDAASSTWIEISRSDN